MTRISQTQDSAARDFFRRLENRGSASTASPRRRSRLDNFFANWGGNGGFQGGRVDRLTEDWNPGSAGPNRLYQMGARRMRERARDLVNNNPLAKSAVESWITNVIECGLLPKPNFADQERRRLWVRAWNRWGGESASSLNACECDSEGDRTISELQALWLEEVIVGGGCLVHYQEAGRRGRYLPLTLQLIPMERFADHLDHWGLNSKTRNPVYNGVEVDGATNRTVAYHVLRSMPNDLNFDPEDTIRIPAEQCSYGYLKNRAGQKTGHTMLHACIVWLWALGYYTDNELYASDIKSSWAYMILTNADAIESGGPFDWNGLKDSSPESGTTDFYGNLIDKHQAGMVFRGAPGDDIKAVGPNVPGADSMPWIMLIQRLISIGASLSYEEAVRDYSKGSFSSVRAAANADRKRFRRMQRFATRHMGNPTWGQFVMQSSRAGLDGFPPTEELIGNFDEWLDVSWSYPGWQSVNPREDAMADDIRLNNGTATRKQIIERDGTGDIDEHFAQLEREQQAAKALGLRFASADPNGGEPDSVAAETEVDV
jgi:lambda family phage portal protein